MVSQHNTDTARRRHLKRARARPRSYPSIHKATLVTSLLWLVAFTTSHHSNVKAFVLATERPSTSLSSTSTALHKHQHKLATITPASDILGLYASTLAEADPQTRPSSKNSPIEDLLAHEERPEDVLDLSNSPLLLLPTNGDNDQKKNLLAKIPDEDEVLEWAGRYTSVEALREHFGSNQNKLWGDLQASTARRLYKTLLPRALLDLSKLGKVQPQDLAPLAYQARVAAKLYARERCTVPARIAATLFDGFRQWIKYGKFQGHGMTYDQLWEKYAEKILQETEGEDHHFLHHSHHHKPSTLHHHHRHHFEHDHDEEDECDPFHEDCEDLAEQVCRKILERACVSNESVDKLALKGQDLADETELQPEQRRLLETIRSQLEHDMYQLLLPPGVDRPATDEHEHEHLPVPPLRTKREKGKFRLVKRLAKQRRFWKLQKAKKELARTMELNSKDSATSTKPWRKARPKAWLSRNKPSCDSDSDTETTEEETAYEEEQEELQP